MEEKQEKKEHKPRRSKVKTETAEVMKKELERLQAEAEAELAAEKRLLEEKEETINQLCKEDDLYCGVILSPDDIIAIVAMAMKVQGNIKIPFKLYYNE